MCCDEWNTGEPNGECSDCGEPTVDGHAAKGCNYSPVICESCGSAPCDQSC
jgi:hypothetical protein